ncbi:Protein of unknown function [Methanolobus vulcani]|uniref:DUF3375 domain-containing protein n=1 Tax=Methanolobus vulcani TaxID=38026 RepID=A0A7Z7B255_9EURY|nr:DUF3375 domain-containing protein [Methanolobus vulcani]SDF93516.1 Protein of unknown function [Methanolobus vulcani]
MEYQDIKRLKDNHPSLKLLNADNSPLIISFLYRKFKENNVSTVPKNKLESSLSDYLYSLKEDGIGAYPRTPSEYLDDWTNADFLRAYYSSDDEVNYDLTHHTEKALEWIKSLLEARKFVGTESRLLKIISTLKEIAYENTDDPTEILEELEKQKRAIEVKIDMVKAGANEKLTETQIKERYLETCDTINKMLADFREIEYNFRKLDMDTRKKLIEDDVKKDELLDDIFYTKDHLRNSDQGQSLDAFWKLLLSPTQLDELDKLIGMTLNLREIQDIKGQDDTLEEMKIRLIEAGDKVNKVNRSLAEQLSRFLDERSYLENKRIIALIKEIKSTAIRLKDNPPSENDFITIEGKPEIEMVMERPLWRAPSVTKLRKNEMKAGSSDEVNPSALFDKLRINRRELKANIEEFLDSDSQVSLKTILEKYPITKGVLEFLVYADIASKSEKTIENKDVKDRIPISNMITGKQHEIEVFQIIFCRN